MERLKGGGDREAIQQVLERGRAWDYQPTEPDVFCKLLEERLQKAFQRIDPGADLAALTVGAGRILDVAGLLALSLDLWQAQNQLLDTYTALADSGSMSPSLHEAFA